MLGGFGIGHWFGFRIRVDYSWFFVFALVTWTFAAWEFPNQLPGLDRPVYLLMGIVGALLLFLSVVLHELAHSVVARARGIPVEGITLFIFGGVAEMRMEARRPVDEFLLTVVGPLSSLGLAAAFLGLASLAGLAELPAAATVAGTLSVLNLVLAVFNLIPAFPLDGGRILRSVLWRLTGDLSLATRWATLIGRGFGWLLIMAGLYLFLQGYALSGAWGVLLGWFLTSAATSAARQDRLRQALTGVAVERVMRQGTAVVPAELSVAELVDRYFLNTSLRACAVARGGQIIGLVTTGDVGGVDAVERSATPVFEIMRPIAEIPAVEHDVPVLEVLARLRGGREDRVLVIREGEFQGVLTVQDVAAWIERARELGVQSDKGERGD
jgi:Zn-dependent protease